MVIDIITPYYFLKGKRFFLYIEYFNKNTTTELPT